MRSTWIDSSNVAECGECGECGMRLGEGDGLALINVMRITVPDMVVV